VFRFARLSSGLHEVSVERSTPPIDVSGPITLELVPGAGLAAPTGRRDRRRGAAGDRPPTDRLLLLRLNDGMPTDLEAWLGRGFSVTEVADPLDLVARVQSEPAGVICVYAEPEGADEAIRTCRSVRALSSAVLLVLSERPLRAADRARAIDAGADDVLAHDIDLRELEARLRRAAETGARRQPAEERPRPEPVDRLLGAEEMSSEVAGRLGAEALSVFSLLVVSGPDEEMGARLFESVRTDQGDLVGRAVDGWAVLLQDARASQAEAFLRRVRDALAGTRSGRRLEAEILSSPAQADRIRAVVGA
jgi:CheY-like chemotaxis protein